MEHESDSDTNCSWRPWNNPEKPGKRIWVNWKSEEELSLPD